MLKDKDAVQFECRKCNALMKRVRELETALEGMINGAGSHHGRRDNRISAIKTLECTECEMAIGFK